MPFDPKLIRDDASFVGDLKLPSDLALMAEQLGEDAARLAAAYPPPATTVLAAPRQVAPRDKNAWLIRSFAGICLAAGLVGVSLVALNFQRPRNTNHPVSVIATPPPAAGSLLLPESLATEANPPSVTATPASWLGDASGPELEALMDLWERDQPAVRSLSF